MSRTRTFRMLAAVGVGLLASGCVGVGSDGADSKPQATPEAARTSMLMDEAPSPSLGGPVRLQERPEFPIDDTKRPYAMLSDGGNRAAPGDKPVRLAEPKPQ